MKTLLVALLLSCSLLSLHAQELKLAPQVYLHLHRGALNPAGPDWKATMEKLLRNGDAFTIEYFKQMQIPNLDPESAQIIASTVEAIGKRVAKETDSEFVKQIEPWFQSAALADLTCDPIEGILPGWVLKKVRENIDRPGVRAEVTRIQNSPAASANADSLAALAAARVKSYAGRILAAASAEAVGGAIIPGGR